jgi:hypothetical protein
MKILSFLICFSLVPIGFNAQIISQFTWDSGLPSTADIGPDATSISSSAFIDAGGVRGTNGLNAGLPKMNIHMIIPGSPTFDVNGIDVAIDYHREENSGNFVKRGASLELKGFKNLSVSYRVDDGSGGFTTVSSGNVYSIPNDNTFRNYRFYYLPDTGFGALVVDGVIVWSNDGPDFRNMYWAGSGDLIVGSAADGKGLNNTFFDNLVIASVSSTPLPIELLSFNIEYDEFDDKVFLDWVSSAEENNDYFEILRSSNGLSYEVIGTVPGSGNSTQMLAYEFVDENPLYGTSYYKLAQTDYDGGSEEFGPKVLNNLKGTGTGECVLVVYPNPCPGNCRAKLTDCPSIGTEMRLMLADATGNIVEEIYPIRDFDGSFDVQIDVNSNMKPGLYIITALSGEEKTSTKLIKG